MRTEDFMVVYSSVALHEYINRAVRKKTRVPEVRDDCRSEAWIQISHERAGMTDEFYMDAARKAIHREYMRNWRHWQRKKKLCRIARQLGGDNEQNGI